MKNYNHKSHQTIKQRYPIKGMHCASCASTIKRKLEKIDGVESCLVNVATEKAQIIFDPNKVSLDQMNQQINKFGYSLMDSDESVDHFNMNHSMHESHEMMTPISSDISIKEQKLKELSKLKKHVQIVLPMVVVSIFVMFWEIGAEPLKFWPKMPEVIMEFFHHLLPIFATYALFVIGQPYLGGMWRFIKHRVASMDTLVGIGTSVAFLYSFIVSAFEKELASFINTQATYYDVTIVVIGFITLGKYLEAKSKLKTGEAIEKLLQLQVRNATILRAGKEIEVSIDEVVVGDIVIVKPGQMIPLDGTIIEGTSAIDESMITGESIPVDKKEGDSVVGSTINKHGYLKIEVTKVGKDTVLSQIIRMVEEAQGSKAPIEKLADQVSAIFVPTVLVFSIITLLIWLVVGSQFIPLSQAFTLGLLCFVGILVIACPCAMGLATPTAVIVGVGRAAQNGILIKNAENLEKFDKIDYVVLDKTGTITKGQPEVTDIKCVGKESEKQVLKLLASLENQSEHPLAQAIVKKAKEKKIVLNDVKHFSVLEGKGLKGMINSTEYFAGNLKLVRDLNLKVDEKIINTFTAQGKTPIVFMTKKQIIAYILVADQIKEDAKKAVSELHKQGLKVAILTGDNQKTANYIGGFIGIDRIIAEVLPRDKAREVKKLQHEGYKVAMVGDGINDAPALASADVGVAMGTGTDVAIETAGITLLGGNISKLPIAFNLSRRTMSTIKQNLFWAFFYNIIGIPIAAGILYPFFGVLLNPAIAGAAMGLSSVSVVVNSLRLKTIKV